MAGDRRDKSFQASDASCISSSRRSALISPSSAATLSRVSAGSDCRPEKAMTGVASSSTDRSAEMRVSMLATGCAEGRATAAGFARATGSAAARASKLFGLGARSGADRAATGIPSSLTVGNTGRRTVPTALPWAGGRADAALSAGADWSAATVSSICPLTRRVDKMTTSGPSSSRTLAKAVRMSGAM